MKQISKALFYLLIFIAFYSCKKDFSKISTSGWKPEVAAPFFHTTIVLNNLFAVDSNLITQPDSSLIYIINKDSVFSLSADTLLNISTDINQNQLFSLGELSMDMFGVNSIFSLQDMLPFINQDAQDSLLKYNGSEYYFPPFQLDETATVDADDIENFVQLSFSQGKMYVDIINSLPVSLRNIDLEIIDKKNNFIIKHLQIDLLSPNEQFIDSTDITGLELGNKFQFKINSAICDGSFPEMVLIDLNKGMDMGLQAKKLKIIAGEAKIVEQIMYSEIKTIDFPMDSEELYHIIFDEGNLNYNFNSNLNVSLNVKLILPTATINGQIPQQEFSLDAGGSISKQWNIGNMEADLTTDPLQAFNKLPVELEILILPTDYLVVFDSSDKVSGNFNMQKLNLFFADGYYGKQSTNISQDTFNLDFDFLKNLQGELILEEPSIKIDYENGIGVPFRISSNFYGLNTVTGQSHLLVVDSVDINSPQQPGNTYYGEINIDKDNSSIVDFLAIRPNKIIYSGGGITNPNGKTPNFLNKNSNFIGNAEIKIPLILRADHLSFSDTLGFSATSEGFPIQEGLMQLNVVNGFPFDLTISLILYDSISGNTLDKITFDNIPSAKVDESGKVNETTSSEIVVDFTRDFLENMKISNRAFIEIETSSFGQGGIPVVLYSDYEIEIAIGFMAKINP